MRLIKPIHWEDALQVVIPRINADGLLMQTFDPLLPVQVHFYSFDPRTDYRLCRHPYFEIFYLSSGEATFRLGEQLFPMTAGDLIIVNSAHFHNMEVKERLGGRQVVRGVLLHFLPEMFRSAGALRDEAGYLEPFLHKDEGFPYVVSAETGIPKEIHRLILEIAGLLPANTVRARLTAKTYLQMILVRLLNHYSSYRGEAAGFERKHRLIERLDPLFRYLDEHYAEPITLDDAAHVVGISKSHFIHLMKQATGMSLVAYLNQFRVSKAQTLMAETNVSLAEIGYAVGFSDQSYFGQVFRKFLRTTPRDYRLRLNLSSHELEPNSSFRETVKSNPSS